jgi:Zn-dependent protease with chaperone function
LPQLQFFGGETSETAVLKGVFMPLVTVPSIVGVLCIMGLAVACAYFGLMTVFGHKLASRALHVVEVSEADFEVLHQQVRSLSQQMAIKSPKIGIVEDLKPNAFALGYGRNSMLVLSIGLLTNFSDDELTAILAHELAHIKQNDFFFKTASYSLNILSFFTPLSYFVSAQALKERELLADEKAAKFLNQPHLLANVLIKAETMLQAFPREPLTSRFSTSLFLISPLAHRTSVLAAHPRVTSRVRNILSPRPKLKLKPKKVMALALLLIFVMVPAVVFTVHAESSYLPKNSVVFVLGAPDSPTQNDTCASSTMLSLDGNISPKQSSNSTFLFIVHVDSLPLDVVP